MENAVAAHLNFIGDSIIGNDVNFEAGSVTANHYNERVWNEITVIQDGNRIQTGSTRFGSLIGDHGRIGANAVLSPGTLLQPNTVVGRLQLVDQLKSWMR
jgi:bifunctional N-acetylglucosamine-1-phosphate-uridyltransferase/glucosamine-1-phosphate-acetyltransferase GlmU-like protein